MMIFTPLPPAMRPAQGVRSSGMVWARSLLLVDGAAIITLPELELGRR
jgi:hypothetical protein